MRRPEVEPERPEAGVVEEPPSGSRLGAGTSGSPRGLEAMGVSAPGLAQGALPLVLGTTRLGGALPVVTKSTSAERESGGASSPWVLKPPSRIFWPPSTLRTVAANHLGPLLGVSRRTT